MPFINNTNDVTNDNTNDVTNDNTNDDSTDSTDYSSDSNDTRESDYNDYNDDSSDDYYNDSNDLDTLEPLKRYIIFSEIYNSRIHGYARCDGHFLVNTLLKLEAVKMQKQF